MHRDFIDVVEKSRGSKLKKVRSRTIFRRILVWMVKLKTLGLIDEVGDANQILRKKFGEDVVIKKFEKSKGWLSKNYHHQMIILINLQI